MLAWVVLFLCLVIPIIWFYQPDRVETVLTDLVDIDTKAAVGTPRWAGKGFEAWIKLFGGAGLVVYRDWSYVDSTMWTQNIRPHIDCIMGRLNDPDDDVYLNIGRRVAAAMATNTVRTLDSQDSLVLGLVSTLMIVDYLYKGNKACFDTTVLSLLLMFDIQSTEPGSYVNWTRLRFDAIKHEFTEMQTTTTFEEASSTSPLQSDSS
jgi:hypothetical protein